jgi:hypothetical protein
LPGPHPTAEKITVISGALHLGMGEKFDDKGPFEIKYVNPADDPRNAKQ